jgi:hypothetical protein
MHFSIISSITSHHQISPAKPDSHIPAPIKVGISYQYMKTTVEIPDRLLREAKAYAASHGITLREVLETGLRTLLEEHSTGKRFRLKIITTKGEGLACDPEWNTIRSIIYEGHGG